MAKTILSVEGMSCRSCIGHVAAALKLDGVRKVDVQLDAGTVEIEHEVRVSTGTIVVALAQAGFVAVPRLDDRAGHV